MKISNPIYISAIHILCFISGYVVTQIIFSHSDSISAYSLLNAWWFSLYVGVLTGVNLRSLLFTLPMAVIVLSVLYTTGLGNSFYHDAPVTLSFKMVIVILMQSVLMASPILINSGISLVTRK